MKGRNVLVIMSDEHSRHVGGAYGNNVVRTPNLDRLAADGTLFENAYCNSPICVPSRASFATGQYVHNLGTWDNAIPYRGSPSSWAGMLNRAGVRCDSIGKLHYRSVEDPNGFAEEILPLHVLDGEGDIQGMLRSPPLPRKSTAQLAGDAGEGDSTYLDYDRKITDAAVRWLGDASEKTSDTPWCLFVSLVCPHFPLVAPPEYFRLYPPESLPFPRLRDPQDFPDHPVLRKLREVQNYEDYFRDEAHIRTALAAYYGMVSFLDNNVGRIIDALDVSGLGKDTLVVYTSDHGDNLGNRTLWGKSNLYEDAAGVPMVMRGPGVTAGKRVKTPVSLVDICPTILQETGVPVDKDITLAGTSLRQIAEGAEPDRTVFSEYHAVGSMTGMFMVRFGRYKYVYYDGYDPQLFDLDDDPEEVRDLAKSHEYEAIRAEGERRLREICDPAEVTARAFADQKKRIIALGGEEEIRSIRTYPYTPAPGEAPRYT